MKSSFYVPLFPTDDILFSGRNTMVLISITLCSAWHMAGVDELLASVIYAVWAGFAYINTVSDGLHV